MFFLSYGWQRVRVYWDLGFMRVFLCTIVFSLIIVRSLQLRGHRQIAEPRKYCLMRVIVFFDVCFLYLFCFSQVEILVKLPTPLWIMSFLFQDNSLDLIGWLDFDTSVAPCSKIIGVCSSSFSFFLVLISRRR